MKYLNPKNYIRRGFRFLNRGPLQLAEQWIAPNADLSLRYPPVFFLGAPRSGSTLAMQVIADCLDLGYISNRHCRWFGAPALAERVFRPTRDRPRSDYQSNQGTTRGNHAPAECGEWWYRFFRRKPPYVTLEEVDPRRMQHFRRSTSALIQAFDRPVIFKNLYVSLRIQAIAHYLPESLFIVIHRDEIDNGHSLLEARFQRFGSYDPWLSVEPPEIEKLKLLPAHEQVIEQFRHTHQTILKDFKKIGVDESRRFNLVYEDFCKNPKSVIDGIHSFLESHGCSVERRSIPPESFRPRKEVRIDPSVFNQMREYALATSVKRLN